MPWTNGATAADAGTVEIGGDITVNRLGFGAMRITGRGIWGDPPDRTEAGTVLRRAVELGVNFIDTADSYGPKVSEELIAEALHPYPDDLVIATKGGLLRPGAGRWLIRKFTVVVWPAVTVTTSRASVAPGYHAWTVRLPTGTSVMRKCPTPSAW